MIIGADQDPYFRALDLDLTEKPEPEGELWGIDAGTALPEALNQRPEVEAVRDALANDDTSIRIAHNHLKPDLSLTGFYQSNCSTHFISICYIHFPIVVQRGNQLAFL